MSVFYRPTANDLLSDPSEVGNLDDTAIQWLLHRGVSIRSIGRGLAVRSGRVVFDPHFKRYRPSPLGEFALIVPAMADPGTTMLDLQATDLAAWSPKSDRIATRLGYAFALGEEQIGVDGFGTTGLPIPVHRSPLGWLRDERRGIVLVDWEMAAYTLSGLILEAEDETHRDEITRRLTPVSPTIVISFRKVAA